MIRPPQESFMDHPSTYRLDLPPHKRPAPFVIPQEWYPGVQNLWQEATARRRYDPLFGIRGIIIHATNGQNAAQAMSIMKASRASWHWLVPGRDAPQHGQFVWACAPESRAALHIRNDRVHPALWGGKNLMNHWTLAITLVQTGGRFSDWQHEITAQIVRYAWARYPNLVHVASHAMVDPKRFADPGPGFDWKGFKRRVLTGDMAEPRSAVRDAIDLADLPPDRSRTACFMEASELDGLL